MEEKKFLNEENYQKSKKKITKIALIILIVGVTIGLGLIISGLILSHNAKSINIDLNPTTENTSPLRTQEEVQADIITTESKINSLNSEISTLSNELWSIQIDEGLSENYYEKQKQIETKKLELSNLKIELNKYKQELNKIKANTFNDSMSGNIDIVENVFNTASSEISKAKYTPLYIIGAFIIIASGIISFSIYMFAKRRDILAFGAQSVVPVAKEVVEDVSPTIGKAGGTIAKELAPGLGSIAREVSQGIKGEPSSSENSQDNNINQ